MPREKYHSLIDNRITEIKHMIRIGSLSKKDQEELFLNMAQKTGMPSVIIEKDFQIIIRGY